MVHIELVEHDPAWAKLFAREAERLRGVLGEQVLRLEHVGSTAVPGLDAKPIVDMLLLVADSADEGSYLPALQRAGYVLRHREPEWYEHRMFKGPDDTEINLHVFSIGCTEAERMLAFRDRLRAEAADRAAYERTKHELARHDWPSVQDYADAKSTVITEILARASGGAWA